LHMAARSGDTNTWQYISRQVMGLRPWSADTEEGLALPDGSKTTGEWLCTAGTAAGGRTVLHFAAQGGNEGIVADILGLVTLCSSGPIEPQQQQKGPSAAAVAGAGSAWLMARDDEGRLAWHLAAEQVG
jgi:hypothetical protein